MFLHLHLLAAVYDITDFDRTAAIDSFKTKREVVKLHLCEGKYSTENCAMKYFNIPF